jgi:hypothetical protein
MRVAVQAACWTADHGAGWNLSMVSAYRRYPEKSDAEDDEN